MAGGGDLAPEIVKRYIVESETILQNAEEDTALLSRASIREDDTTAIVARLRGHQREWEKSRWRK